MGSKSQTQNNCANPHENASECADSHESAPIRTDSEFSVSITDAFETGKIAGALDILLELEELSIVDAQFNTYIKMKRKNFQEKLDLINEYKKLTGG